MSYLILLLILLVALGFGVIPRNKFYPKGLKNQKVNGIFLGYLFVLIAASIYSIFLPEGTATLEKGVKEAEVENYVPLSELAQKGRIEDAEGVVMKEARHFSIEGESVEIQAGAYPYLVFVKKSEELSGKIEAKMYATRSFINQMEITDKIPSPDLKLKGDQLIITEPKLTELKFLDLSMPFPFQQFAKENRDLSQHSATFGEEIIYLTVPKEIKVIGNIEIVQSE